MTAWAEDPMNINCSIKPPLSSASEADLLDHSRYTE